MVKKRFSIYWIALCCLLLAPVSLWAFEFSMPEDVSDEELTGVLGEETDYGDSKYPLSESERPVRKRPEPVVAEMDSPETEGVLDSEAEEPDFIEIPLVEAETTIAEEVLPDGEGRIVGQVFDKETGAPVRGVAIAVEGTDLGTITDEAGNFKINAVPEGNYTLAYFKTGYLEANITDIAVKSGEIKALDFALPPRPAEMSDDVYDLGTITVTADEVASQNALLLEVRQQSVASVDAISSEDFSRFAASDAADVLKSVTGVSISGGKFAVVRGLDDRFSTVSLNGIVVPSPDPNRLAVPLDIFPSGLLESVVIQKSYTPDQPGESSGGSINLKTKSFPEEFTFRFSAGLGYNENATGEDDFLLAAESHFQPSPFRFSPKNKTAGLDTSFSGEIGGSISLSEADLGIISGFSYNEKYNFSEVSRNRYDDNGSNTDIISSAIQQLSEFEEQFSALFGLSLRLSDVSELSYTGLYAKKYEAIGSFSTIETDAGPDNLRFEVNAGTVEREYYNHQLVFDHTFDRLLKFQDIKFTVAAAYSENSQDEPDTRVSDRLEDGPEPGTFNSADLTTPQRFERSIDQEDLIFKLDIEVPLDLPLTEDSSFKFGISNEDSKRVTAQREFVGNDIEASGLDDLGGFNPDSIIDLGFGDPIIVPGDPHFEDIPGVSLLNTGVAESVRQIQSVYLQAIVSPISNLELTAGARIEDTFIKVNSLEPGLITRFQFAPFIRETAIDEIKLLPAVTASYEADENLKFRFGISETVAKPSFRELNPNPVFNPNEGDAEIGNPSIVFQNEEAFNNNNTDDTVLPLNFSGLELVDVFNADARLEWFFSNEDLIAASLFHKKIDGPIERIRVLTGNGSSFTFFNNDKEADVFGAEFEAKLSLRHISDWLRDFYIGGNYTYIDAEVERSTLEAEILPIEASKTRTLYNQPEDILNAFISYRNQSTGLDVTLSANQVGDQLFAVTASGDIITEAYLTLNLIIKWQLTENFSINVSAKNLLDPRQIRRLEAFGAIDDPASIGDDGGIGNSSTDFSERDSFRAGRSYGISAGYKF